MRNLRKVTLCLIFMGCCLAGKAHAQYDRNYFFDVGRNFIFDNKFRDAIEVLNVLLQADDKAYEAYFWRGVAKFQMNDLVGAEQDFSKALELNPVFTAAYQNRALARSRLGKFEKGIEDFNEAISLRPDIMRSYYQRGATYFSNKQFDKAIEDFDTYIRRESRDAWAYVIRGLSRQFLKDTLGAKEDFTAAIDINKEDPWAYVQRGALYMAEKDYPNALEDLDAAINLDPEYMEAYFNRAIIYSETNRPVESISNFTAILQIDSASSQSYFNRALLRSQIGDFNNALKDYDKVALLTPGNVLVYYNRAGLNARIGNYPEAIADYTKAIELYPDFANAYLGRSNIRNLTNDLRGSESDRLIATEKIREYRSRHDKESFSVYADTSRVFNKLLSFDAKMTGPGESTGVNRMQAGSGATMLPMFKFTFASQKHVRDPEMFREKELGRFLDLFDDPQLQFARGDSGLPTERLMAIDASLEESTGGQSWQKLFEKGISQSLLKQYTGAIAAYTAAIDLYPANGFLYLNRSATQSEMIDFISSIDNRYEQISVGSGSYNRITERSSRSYNYDDAIADLNKAAKLLPDFAYVYYNRANLYCRSEMVRDAIDDYSKAIALDPTLGEAYFNRGLARIFINDTAAGTLDLSKAGELGITEAYELIKFYSNL